MTKLTFKPPSDIRGQRTLEAIVRAITETWGEDNFRLKFLHFLWDRKDNPKGVSQRAVREAFKEGLGDVPVDLAGFVSDFRKELIELNARLGPDACPVLLKISDYKYGVAFDERPPAVRTIPLNDLEAYETITENVPGAKAHLHRLSQLVIYLEDANKLPTLLHKKMIENMKKNITYRYFVPLKDRNNIIRLIVSLVASAKSEGALDILATRLQINFVPKTFPFKFTVHNADIPSAARFYVRCEPESCLVEYCQGDLALQRLQLIMDMWRPIERGVGRGPVVQCCTTVDLSTGDWNLYRDYLVSALTSAGNLTREEADGVVLLFVGPLQDA